MATYINDKIHYTEGEEGSPSKLSGKTTPTAQAPPSFACANRMREWEKFDLPHRKFSSVQNWKINLKLYSDH